MKVVEYLQSGGTIDDLEKRFSIKNKRHLEHPNLVLLKYNQIFSPFEEPIVRECRGLILDEADNWRPVSRSFDKFFNHGEALAAPIDWSTARVQEKVDGSLCTLYWYAGKWHVATTGTPDASGPVEGNAYSFANLFWDTLGYCPPYVSREHTYMFELTSPYNRVVVPHASSRLTLLGVRNMTTLQEDSLEWGDDLAEPVREFPLQSFEDITRSFEALDPLQQEGYVVVDHLHNRVKVKHPGYVAIHHMKGENGPTLKRMLGIAVTGEGSELLAHFPEWRGVYEESAQKLAAFESEVASDFQRITDEIGPDGTQRDFALRATKTKCSAALFNLRAGRAKSPREFFATVPLDRLAEWVGV